MVQKIEPLEYCLFSSVIWQFTAVQDSGVWDNTEEEQQSIVS